MKNPFNLRLSLITIIISSFLISMNQPQEVYIRHNLAGYLPSDSKIALAFSHQKVRGTFSLIDVTNDETVYQGKLKPSKTPTWKKFDYYYQLDFSAATSPGRYYLRLDSSGQTTEPFDIDSRAFKGYHEDLLGFMRQQRCGYNPFIGEACHTQDGRLFYGPVPDSTYVNLTGGWHDAGDQLKYLITSSNATARMLQAFELEPDKFGDYTDTYGNLRANGIPDVLDEAKWGLDWIHKLHFRPDALVHQIADDRDHIGWKLPTADSSDYGWGPNSYRAAYVATGKPQGLGKYKSKATGLANVAGRSAAAMALGYRVWSMSLKDTVFASQCLQAAKSLYTLAKSNQGYQQGNSYGAPYRYNENTWTDDMEWGAVELFKATGEVKYLEDAKGFAERTVGTSWMEHDTASHYELYPYVNVSHYVLYPLVDPETQQKIAGYYRTGIERTLERASTNPFGIGVPFLWCSNNLVVSLITQILLYEKMTGDNQYHQHMLNHRDWLLGRNPWGTSMFTGVPKEADYPVDVHTSLWKMTGREAAGGL